MLIKLVATPDEPDIVWRNISLLLETPITLIALQQRANSYVHNDKTFVEG